MTTLDELEKQRRQWLKDAKEKGTLEALALIAQTLGMRQQGKSACDPTTYMYRQDNLNRQESIILTVRVGTSGVYNLGAGKIGGDYDWQKTFIVEVGDHQTVYLIDKQYDDQFLYGPDFIFVPGKWVDRIMTALSKAQSIFGKSSHDANQEAIKEMEKRLLIGIDV